MADALPPALFWAAVACVAYTYFLYPLGIALLARLRPRRAPQAPYLGTVSVVIAARNEETQIARRVAEFLTLVDDSGCSGQIIVVSDGSTDATATEAAASGDPRVRVVTLNTNVGKAAALTRGCEAANGDVLVFADARQHWDSNALRNLLRNFASPEVGAVGGDLILRDNKGVVTGVGLYWKFERWLRRTEAVVDSTVGVSGSISAVRRALFKPIPERTLLDDVFWPMQVVLQGFRVIHDDAAMAFDRLPDNVAAEFRRKVRTLSGNFQLVVRLPALLVPWRNRIWLQFVSHKMLRLVVPWMLPVILISNFFLEGAWMRALLCAQLAFYAIGALGLVLGARLNTRLTSAVASFLVLNAAAWMAFWVWLGGKAEGSWTTTVYATKAVPDNDTGTPTS